MNIWNYVGFSVFQYDTELLRYADYGPLVTYSYPSCGSIKLQLKIKAIMAFL